MNTTVITALYNIDRETKGDNRKWSEYLDWFKNTLKLNMPMVIFIPSYLKDFVTEHRPPNYKTQIIIQEQQDIPYAYLEPRIREILSTDTYKQHMKDSKRVECILPYYNIIQYSKFKWLKHASEENYFKTNYFFWMDAGISRFIDVFASVKEKLELPVGKLCIQKNHYYDTYIVNDKYLWDSQCLLCGTIFGGDAKAIYNIELRIHKLLSTLMENYNWINNEQILLAYIAKQLDMNLFYLILNNTSNHVCLFDKLFKS